MKDLIEVYNKCFTLKEVCVEYYGNFTTHKQRCLKKELKALGIDVSEIKERYRKSLIQTRYTKICPVCKKTFQVKENDPKVTCSHSCSNTYFNGISRNRNISNYRTIAFRSHKKRCVVCGEDKIVEVHHYDKNHINNEIDNLIPLCPTHHKYYHSRYKYLVNDKIEEFKNKITRSSSTVEQ